MIADTLTVVSHGADSVLIMMRYVAHGVIGRIPEHGAIVPGEEIAIPLRLAETIEHEDTRGLSVTLAVVGRDTTVVTVPIEIKD